MSETQATFDEWAILELLGHVRTAGRVAEVTLFGTAMGRIDIPTPDGGMITQFFGGGSVYRMTPTTEEIARVVALSNQPEPVHRWELEAPHDSRTPDDADEDDVIPADRLPF